jgi:pyridoxamine 5'-phosphate oxidase
VSLHDRREYDRSALNESDLDVDPIEQFKAWLDEAKDCAEIDEALAMTLATANAHGIPSARIVLLREVTNNGFVFYTNYESHKGNDLAENPRAALVFYWGPLERQVRVEGTVARLSDAESDAYFDSRPIKSRIGAIASNQSRTSPSREDLERRFEQIGEQVEASGREPQRPKTWGGYHVQAESVEFWQGQRSRLHDRILYSKNSDDWSTRRLDP